MGASKAWSFSMRIKGSRVVVGGRYRAHELVRTSCRSRVWQQISKKHFISYKTFAGAGRRGAARAGVLALELVRVCSQAPPFLEACSGDVLGSRPVARRGRGSSETRCSDACCALPSPRSRLPKAKEEAAEAELVVGDKSQVIKVVLRQLRNRGCSRMGQMEVLGSGGRSRAPVKEVCPFCFKSQWWNEFCLARAA